MGRPRHTDSEIKKYKKQHERFRTAIMERKTNINALSALIGDKCSISVLYRYYNVNRSDCIHEDFYNMECDGVCLFRWLGYDSPDYLLCRTDIKNKVLYQPTEHNLQDLAALLLIGSAVDDMRFIGETVQGNPVDFRLQEIEAINLSPGWDRCKVDYIDDEIRINNILIAYDENNIQVFDFVPFACVVRQALRDFISKMKRMQTECDNMVTRSNSFNKAVDWFGLSQGEKEKVFYNPSMLLEKFEKDIHEMMKRIPK